MAVIVNDTPSLVVAELVAQHNQLIADLATTSVSGLITAESISVMV